MLQVESCRAKGSCHSVGGYEMAMLTSWIDHYHNSIITMWFGEFANEVNTDSVPANFRDWQWMQLAHWLVTLCLCLKAEITSLAVFTYELWHVGPPVIPRCNLGNGASQNWIKTDIGTTMPVANWASSQSWSIWGSYGLFKSRTCVVIPPGSGTTLLRLK